MVRRLATANLAPRQREEAAGAFTSRYLVPGELRHLVAPDRICWTARYERIAAVEVVSLATTPFVLSRTSSHCRRGAATGMLLLLQRDGVARLQQSRRDTRLAPGQIALLDPRHPFCLEQGRGGQDVLHVPMADLAPSGSIAPATAVALDLDAPGAHLAATFLRSVVDQLTRGAGIPGAVGPAVVELVRVLLTCQPAAPPDPGDDLAARILDYVRVHLHDPDLTAGRVAGAHFISVRRLYYVLAEAGVSLGDWMRAERLEECRRVLASPAARYRTIESVARDAGFNDPTHFGRLFRRCYGMSPREWRQTVGGR